MGNAVAKTLRQLRGEMCWGLFFDPQLNLSMNFGQPWIDISPELPEDGSRDRTRNQRLACLRRRRRIWVVGRWRLWIACAYWKIWVDRETTATSSSPKIRIWRSLWGLQGQRFVGAQVKPDTGRTQFFFDLGGVLDVRRLERSSTEELWLLYKPSGYVLSIYGNGTYDHEPGSETDKRPRIEGRKLPYPPTATPPRVQVWST